MTTVIIITESSRLATVCRPTGKDDVLIKNTITAGTVPMAIIRPQRSGTLARARPTAITPEDSGIPCKRNNRNFSTFTTPNYNLNTNVIY